MTDQAPYPIPPDAAAPTEPKHVVMFSGDDPVIIAVDTTASMNAIDAPERASRMAYAVERVDELIGRLPIATRVTLVTFDDHVTELVRDTTGPQVLRDALGQLTGGGAVSNTGRVLEYVALELLRSDLGAIRTVEPPTLVIITDGYPDDAVRWQAWLDYVLDHGLVRGVHVLGLGYAGSEHLDADRFACGALGGRTAAVDASSPRVWVSPLGASTEIRLSTRTQSDKPEPARAPTVPPSLAPPSPSLADAAPRATDPRPTGPGDDHGTEYVAPAKHGPAAPVSPAKATTPEHRQPKSRR